MKIVIPGGSGQVGMILARAFIKDGHEVVVLSRNSSAPIVSRTVVWDARTPGAWCAEFEDADVIINLAGRNVNCRYTPTRREEIMSSRVDSTRAVGEAIRRAARPPRVWLQASTATIYEHTYAAPHDEETGVLGGSEPNAPDAWRFSIDVAKNWERTALEFALPRTRTVLLRSAMTMSPDRGGVFDTLLGLVRHGLGGRAGDGRQYVSWIHETDFIEAVKWLIEHECISSAVNLAAPQPLPNAEFMRILRKEWGTRIGLPAAEWMLEIGARLLGTETELILKSRRVVSSRLPQSGFAFRFPTWAEAARDLCTRWRKEISR